jgi:hypothetical protein
VRSSRFDARRTALDPSTALADSLRSEFVNFCADRDRFAGWELDDGGEAEVR